MLVVIESTPKEFGEEFAVDGNLQTISEDVLQNGTVYCIKHCFRQEPIDKFRQDIFDYYSSMPQTRVNYDDNALMNGNYHSIERGVSAYQKTLHYFHTYVFNNVDVLPPHLQPAIKGLFYSLASFYNALTQQNRELIGTHADGKRFRPQIMQYPVGGGMFAAHKHALEPQKLGLILGFSKRGRDFKEGGAGFEAPEGTIVDTDSVQDIGDIVIFRYDLKHWVTPCDITSPLDDNQSNGRWSVIIPIF